MYIHYVLTVLFLFQAGLFPFTTADYGSHPLTSGKGSPSERIESFHMAVGNLRCFDARRTEEERASSLTGLTGTIASLRVPGRCLLILTFSGPCSSKSHLALDR